MLQPSMEYNKNRIRAATISFAVVCIVSYGALLFILKPGERVSDIILRTLYIIPVIGSVIACLWASRKTLSYKRLWRLMSLGMFFWMAGELIFLGYVTKYGVANVPSPTLADVFSIAYVPIILGVMFSLGRMRRPFDNEKKQFLANVIMLALAAFLLCYKFLLIPQWFANPDMSVVQKTYAIAYPMFDWIVIVSLLLASHRLQGSHIEGWIVLLISAFSFSIIADMTFYMFGNERNPYTTWALMCTAILIVMSAIDEVTGAIIGIRSSWRTNISKLQDAQALTQRPWRTIMVQFIASVIIPIVWLAYSYDGSKSEIPVLAVATTAILMLLIYRNHLLISANAILFAKSLRDALTGLNNHRYFQEALNKAIVNADKTSKPVSLIIIDIDDFSQVNNLYGHSFGDKVLATMGGAILSKIGEDVEACRLSGDEIGIVLPGTDWAEAFVVAESIRQTVNKALKAAFSDKSIGMSMGVSVYPKLAKDKDELFNTAVGALYWVKMHGKNKTLVYDINIVKALSADERAKRAEEAALIDMVRSLALAVDARDPYTRLHSKRVSEMAAKLAKFIGLDDKRVAKIEIAGMLHDIGKIGIPDNILNKPSKLTQEEMDVVKNHPTLSAQIINSTSLKDVVSSVKAHHERWDGRGYPYNLEGEEIPLEARIIAIADTFDAMVSDRPYRKALAVKDALSEIERCAGTQFDPVLAKQFILMFATQGAAGPGEYAEDQDPNYLGKAV